MEKIANLLPKGGVVFCRDSVNELVAALLSKNNISVAQRVPPSDMEAMAILLGTTVAHSVEDLNGADPAGKVLQFTMGDMQYISIEDVDGGENTVTTLVLRGATRQTLDETERGFDGSPRSLRLMHHRHLSGCSRVIGNHRRAGPVPPRTDVVAEKLLQ